MCGLFLGLSVLVLTACTARGPTSRPLGEQPPSPAATIFAVAPRRTLEREAPAPSAVASLPAPPPKPDPGPLSPPLKNAALRSPMPGGRMAGYAGDTGLDIGGDHLPVFAIASGTLDYAEKGHTHWTRGRDTPYSVRIELDAPIAFDGRRVTHVWYTHLASLAFEQAEGIPRAERRHVEAGERLGVSGIGNGVPHLHLGMLLDGQVEQDDWTYILREHQVRAVLGGYANGAPLAPMAKPTAGR